MCVSVVDVVVCVSVVDVVVCVALFLLTLAHVNRPTRRRQMREKLEQSFEQI